MSVLYTQNRFAPLPFVRYIMWQECIRCESSRQVMEHADYPGMCICFDCFDEMCPPVDISDHSNHWEHKNWDSIAERIGRELVPHGTMQDGRYYPVGTSPPHNRPASKHYKLEEERRRFVDSQLQRSKLFNG